MIISLPVLVCILIYLICVLQCSGFTICSTLKDSYFHTVEWNLTYLVVWIMVVAYSSKVFFLYLILVTVVRTFLNFCEKQNRNFLIFKLTDRFCHKKRTILLAISDVAIGKWAALQHLLAWILWSQRTVF